MISEESCDSQKMDSMFKYIQIENTFHQINAAMVRRIETSFRNIPTFE